MSIKYPSILIPIFIFYLQVILSIGQVIQPTQFVSVNMEDLNSGPVKVYFVCPNVRNKTDIITYYKIINNEAVLIKKTNKPYGILLEVQNSKDFGKYECSVLSTNQEIRNATLYVLDENTIKSPKTFLYNTSETTYVVGTSESVELNCGNLDADSVTWYRPPQYRIYSGNKFKLENINQYDYGTYYCAIGNISKSSLDVKKVLLVKETPVEKEKSINEEVKYIENLVVRSKSIRYRSQNLIKSNDVAVWEQPPGTILLNHGRDLYIPFLGSNSSDYLYRINRNGDLNINLVGKVLISFKETQDIAMDLRSPISYGSPVTVNCMDKSDLRNETKIVWKKNGILFHRGNTLKINQFKKDAYGKYSCEIEKDGGLRSRFLNLQPDIRNEKQITMKLEPGDIYIYHSGNKKELHCEILREHNDWIFKSSEIQWTMNNRRIMDNGTFFPSQVKRLDTTSVSILILKDMTIENEGTYKCFQGSLVHEAKLVMEQIDVIFELSPVSLTVADNVNQQAEFHCRIDTPNINSSSIIWKFIPEKSSKQIDLPPEAKVERPLITSSTSFVTISNALKRHEGMYICQVDDKKLFGRLIVKTRPVLKVSPPTITVKPGGTARFLCSLENVDGEVNWRRADKQTFTINKENRFGVTTRSMLEILHVTANEDRTIYECVFHNLIEQVQLLVQEDCPLDQRKCKNDTCIDERKFCDGKDDCGDNSDEDRQKCNECSPNSMHCDFLNNSIPTKRCIINHWKCDGVDDCGNNFDEMNCPIKNQDKCIGTQFRCNNQTLIPRSYWCDDEPDCPSNEDEEGCHHPVLIEPAKTKHISIFSNSTLTLKCKVSGRPVPAISWRYNWGHFPENLEHNITNTVSNCSLITSILTVYNIKTDHSGIYSCEAVAKRRVMAPDFIVSVSKSLICQRPFYNNDAWHPDMCIKCYCSNLTDDCTSATGYVLNPNSTESGIRASDAAIVNYKTWDYYKPARTISFANEEMMMYFINETYYEDLVPDPDYYFGGAFNIGGSWLTKYGNTLSYRLILSGEITEYITGPAVVIQGSSTSLYNCGLSKRFYIYPNYENNINIMLWEQDLWFKDYRCSQSATREDFLNVLVNVRLILFKVKYFYGQTNFRMSKISIKEAIKSNDDYSWIGVLEKCNCPTGYSGLSCEIKSE